MRRREFITLLGGAAAWPLVARAQQPAMPLIGFLYAGSPETSAHLVVAFRKGLGEAGHFEGHNVAIEFRFAQGHHQRLPELAAELVRRRVAVIATPGDLPSTLAAKSATSTIPIVFGTGADPVRIGLVSSLNRPGGNITGITVMLAELVAKRLALMKDLIPAAGRFGVLVNPDHRGSTEPMLNDLRAAAGSIGGQLEIVTADTSRAIETAFATLAQRQVDAMLNLPNALFTNRRVQIAILAAHYRLPAVYTAREFVEVGGLMSYGPSFSELFRQVGIYVGRVLKGERPADLPVLRPTKFELVITLPTARLLGLTVPPALLALADEVIE
jgi:putative tryptophan/tyrosine transport system substrate-binding protein